jgi:hypothetical protein
VEWTGLIKCRGGTSPASGIDRRRALSAINAEVARPRGLTLGSARWLTSCAPCHMAASGLRQSGEQKCARYGPDTCRLRTPPSLDQGLGILCPRIPGPCCEWPGPHAEGSRIHLRGSVCARGDLGPYPEVQSVYTGVRHFPVGFRTHC